jgi:serine/threonine-protein kinase SRPK3
MLDLHTTQTFELLTGRWLFNPQSGPTWTTEDDHLAKMMELTGETFNETTLSASRNRNEYFDDYGQYTFRGLLVIIKSINCVLYSGKLLRIDQLLPVSLEKAMMEYGLPEAEVIPAANFLRACLHLNPEERSSASDLEAHPWLETAYMCC